MVFNSFSFLVFLIVVFYTFWYLGKGRHQLQNIILLAASCTFYMFFVPSYILILLVTILIDYSAGLFLQNATGRKRKAILVVSIVSTCLVLFFFKYFNFFTENLNGIATLLGWNYSIKSLHIILPIGLSFHTFQSLSYVIEVYRNNQKPERNFITYALYVMFFPQLVAGPIERPSNLLNQLNVPVKFNFDFASEGVRMILWGLFKKVVIADLCSMYVDIIFRNYHLQTGSTLFIGSFFFAFQIYCDFSGYTEIARGTAQLFGYRLVRNFQYPFFVRNIGEFWHRWHISLTTWFRDYVYIPLGGSRAGKLLQMRNIVLVFLISALWHGANWTYLVWGALNALLFLIYFLRNKTPFTTAIGEGRMLPSIKEMAAMIATILPLSLTWIFFRAESVSQGWGYLKGIFTPSFFSFPTVNNALLLLLIALFISVEWLQRNRQHGLDVSHLLPWQRKVAYALVFAAIFFFGIYPNHQFIYFQF